MSRKATIVQLVILLAVFAVVAHAMDEQIGTMAYLPLIRQAYPPPTLTPTPTMTPAPTQPAAPTPTRPSSSRYEAIVDGGFEEGSDAWLQVSAQDDHPYLIRDRDGLPRPPHAGEHAVWLGQRSDYTNGVAQAVTIPENNPIFEYWIWIDSDASCSGEDVGGAALIYSNDEIIIDVYQLCEDTDTDGWIVRSGSLAAYSGDRVGLLVLAGNDGSTPSHLYVDDVSLTGTNRVLNQIDGSSDAAGVLKDYVQQQLRSLDRSGLDANEAVVPTTAPAPAEPTRELPLPTLPPPPQPTP